MSDENNRNDDGQHDDDHHVNYTKIYVTLLILFAISVMGPFIGEITGIALITLVTAFGIALVKANLVIQNFMHLRWEKKIMKWMLTSSLVVVALFVAGVAPDVYNHEGDNWENLAAKAAVERGIAGGEHDAKKTRGGGAAVEVATAGFNAAGSYVMICAACHGATVRVTALQVRYSIPRRRTSRTRLSGRPVMTRASRPPFATVALRSVARRSWPRGVRSTTTSSSTRWSSM